MQLMLEFTTHAKGSNQIVTLGAGPEPATQAVPSVEHELHVSTGVTVVRFGTEHDLDPLGLCPVGGLCVSNEIGIRSTISTSEYPTVM